MTSEVYVLHAVLLRPRLASIELCYFLTPWPLAMPSWGGATGP